MRKLKKSGARSSKDLPLSGQLPTENLARRDENGLTAELAAYQAIFAPLFTRSEQREWAHLYLRGQLSDLERKSIEPMVLNERGVDPNAVRAVQQFIGEGAWSDEAILDQHQKLVGKNLGEDDGVAIIDLNGFPKKGKHSVGVATQYCNALGKVTNCQQGVFVVYATRRGYTFADRRLYMPREWFDDERAELRKKCRVPTDLKFKTETQLSLEMLKGLVRRGSLPFRWVAVRERYGMNHPAFLNGVARLGKWYFVEISVKGALEVRRLSAQLPEGAWRRYTIEEGSKGSNAVEFAFLRASCKHSHRPDAEVWVVLRRGANDLHQINLYLSNAPIYIPHSELARVSGLIWSAERAIEEGKSKLGMDHYETRTWQGWHHHMTMVFLAHHFLVRLLMKLQNSYRYNEPKDDI